MMTLHLRATASSHYRTAVSTACFHSPTWCLQYPLYRFPNVVQFLRWKFKPLQAVYQYRAAQNLVRTTSTHRARCELLTTVSKDHKTARSLGRWHINRIKSKEIQSSLIHYDISKTDFELHSNRTDACKATKVKRNSVYNKWGLPLHHFCELHSIQLDWSRFD
jgi:hypothetical protein